MGIIANFPLTDQNLADSALKVGFGPAVIESYTLHLKVRVV
jgi:hypothetical protein